MAPLTYACPFRVTSWWNFFLYFVPDDSDTLWVVLCVCCIFFCILEEEKNQNESKNCVEKEINTDPWPGYRYTGKLRPHYPLVSNEKWTGRQNSYSPLYRTALTCTSQTNWTLGIKHGMVWIAQLQYTTKPSLWSLHWLLHVKLSCWQDKLGVHIKGEVKWHWVIYM